MNKALSEAVFKEHTQNLADPRLLKARSWEVNEINYPKVDITFRQPGRKPFRVRLHCNQWDSAPPAIELLADDGSYLSHLPSGSGVLNQGPHPTTKRPFICTPGALEYHVHPGHINDYWDNYKGKPSFDLGGIITQIWNAWKKTND